MPLPLTHNTDDHDPAHIADDGNEADGYGPRSPDIERRWRHGMLVDSFSRSFGRDRRGGGREGTWGWGHGQTRNGQNDGRGASLIDVCRDILADIFATGKLLGSAVDSFSAAADRAMIAR